MDMGIYNSFLNSRIESDLLDSNFKNNYLLSSNNYWSSEETSDLYDLIQPIRCTVIVNIY